MSWWGSLEAKYFFFQRVKQCKTCFKTPGLVLPIDPHASGTQFSVWGNFGPWQRHKPSSPCRIRSYYIIIFQFFAVAATPLLVDYYIGLYSYTCLYCVILSNFASGLSQSMTWDIPSLKPASIKRRSKVLNMSQSKNDVTKRVTTPIPGYWMIDILQCEAPVR